MDPLGDGSMAEGSTGHPSAAVHDHWRRLLVVHSLVLAVVIPSLLSCSGGDPVLAGWTLSLFMVIYLFCSSCFFSTPATPLANIFHWLSSIGLLAFFAGSLATNVLGMVIMYLDSVLAAGFFGAVLAQHRQSNGTERSALLAVVKAPVGKRRRNLGVYFFLAVVTLAYAPRLVWMMLPSTRYDAMDVAIGLLACLAFLLFIHILCVLGWLNGAVFGDDSSPAVVLWFATVAMLFLGSFALVGKLVAVTVLWLCVLASTAFLGYFLRIHASYNRIMTIRACAKASSTVSPPRTTEGCPASGTNEDSTA